MRSPIPLHCWCLSLPRETGCRQSDCQYSERCCRRCGRCLRSSSHCRCHPPRRLSTPSFWPLRILPPAALLNTAADTVGAGHVATDSGGSAGGGGCDATYSGSRDVGGCRPSRRYLQRRLADAIERHSHNLPWRFRRPRYWEPRHLFPPSSALRHSHNLVGGRAAEVRRAVAGCAFVDSGCSHGREIIRRD